MIITVNGRMIIIVSRTMIVVISVSGRTIIIIRRMMIIK